MKQRPTKDQYFLGMAIWVSSRSTCLRDSVGCVLVNEQECILSSGYNGVAAGLPHCTEETCLLASNKCLALHAELNALTQCQSPFEINTCYCTHTPCSTCSFALLNTSCKRIVFEKSYKDFELLGWIKVPGKNILIKDKEIKNNTIITGNILNE